MGFKTVFEDCDILVVGGGMGGTGAAYEARYWGRDLKIVVAEKPTSIVAAPSRRVCMPLTATWVCSGTRTSLKIMFAMPATT